MSYILLGKDIWSIIFPKLDIKSQLLLRATCTFLYNELQITDLYNIDKKYVHRFTDEIIQQYPHLQLLDLCGNTVVTDVGLKNLTLLHTLDISYNDKITDDGIKDKQLHVLNVNGSKCKITDAGIQDMPLYSLSASGYYSKITDHGVKRMKLNYLDIGNNRKITGQTIRNMPLNTLHIWFIYEGNVRNVSSADIKHIRNVWWEGPDD